LSEDEFILNKYLKIDLQARIQRTCFTSRVSLSRMGNAITLVSKQSSGDVEGTEDVKNDKSSSEATTTENKRHVSSVNRRSRSKSKSKRKSEKIPNIVIERERQKDDLINSQKLSTLTGAKSAATVAALAHEKRIRKYGVQAVKAGSISNEGKTRMTGEASLSHEDSSESLQSEILSSNEEMVESKADTLPKIAIPKIMPNALLKVNLNKVQKPTKPSNTVSADKNLSLKSSKSATKIYGHLFVSGDLIARNKDALIKNGITHILNLAKTVCKNYHENEMKNEVPVFIYKDFNLIDSTKEGGIYPFLLESIYFIEEARKKNGACFVHCHQGVSRSCTVVIAYAMWYERLSFQDAFDMVKSKHSVCGPNSGFLSQLQDWGKRLLPVQESDKKLCLYRVAPHSVRDSSLVIKPCKSKGESTTLAVSVRVLDPRGAFLLHDPKENRLYIWVGKECGDAMEYEYHALKFARLMKKIEPPFETVKLVDCKKPDKRRQFFSLLGGNEGNVSENSEYDSEYDISGSESEETSSAESRGGRRRGRTRASTRESTYRGDHDDSLVVRLYQWQSSENEWKLMVSYEDEDLKADSLYVLTVHDKKLKGMEKESASGAVIHRAFIWLGSAIEEVISEESAIEKAKEYITTKEESTKSKLGSISVTIVKENKETDEFWDAFEAGP